MGTAQIKEEFIRDFWEWFKDYHEKRSNKERGIVLTPALWYHEKHMKFDNYAWDWVALFIKEEYVRKDSK